MAVTSPPRSDYWVYLAGPMTGMPAHNFPAFTEAAAALRAAGYNVFNPAEEDAKKGFDPEKDSAREFFDFDALIVDDIEAMFSCDAVVLLPGWENSFGATAEVSVAMWRGDFDFFLWPTMQPWDPLTEELTQPATEDYPIVVGLNGYGGAGKDTAAEGLRLCGWEVLGFSDYMYKMALILNPIIFWYCIPFTMRFLVNWLGWTKAKRIPGVRKYLQTLGTEAGRDVLGEDVWVNAMRKRLKPGGKYVITNVRFPNEAALVRELGGKIYRIDRPGHGAVNAHSS